MKSDLTYLKEAMEKTYDLRHGDTVMHAGDFMDILDTAKELKFADKEREWRAGKGA